MFLEYFGLIEQPFGVTPDPRFLHLGPKHREALASLVVGTECNRGFLALIAPPGMGKTSLLYQYLEWQRNRARAAYLFQTDCDSPGLMRHLLTDLGINASWMDVPAMHAALNGVLSEEMRAGRRFILVLDEAQNLNEDVLESVRLLSNFETPWMKLMQIVIAGQPQLAQRLARPSLAQLRQRISSIIRLDPFTREETCAYVDHRLWVAGYAGPPLFTVGARLMIAESSGGIPRNINNLCFNAMSIAYGLGSKQIDTTIVREVLSDLEVESLVGVSPEPPRAASSARAFGEFRSPFVTVQPQKKKRRVWRLAPAIVSVAALLFLGVGSGISWDRGIRTPPLEMLPSAEAAVVRAGIDVVLPQAPMSTAPLEAPFPAATSTGAAARHQVLPVVVGKEATLRLLCLEYLGRFDDAALREIYSLNPSLSGSGEIEAGQRLRLPLYLRAYNAGRKNMAVDAAAAIPHEGRP